MQESLVEQHPLLAAGSIAELEHYSPFQSFFQLNTNAICIIDRKSKIVLLNPSAEAIMGPAKLVKGKCVVSYFSEDKQPSVMALLNNVLIGQTERLETDFVGADGKLYHLRINLIPALDANCQVIGVFCVLIDLSRKHLLINALAESEKHYRQLVEFAPVAIIVHRQGNVLFANQAAEQLLFKPLSEADNLYDLIHPVDRPLALARKKQPLGTMLPFIELRIQRADQQYVTVEAGSLQIMYQQQTATLSICRDISSERQAQEAIALSEAKYRMIADNMTDLVALVDAYGTIKYASPSHTTVLGYPVEQLTGSTFADYIHTEDASVLTKHFMQMVQQAEPIRAEFRIKNAAGQWLWLESHGGETETFDSKMKQYLLVSRDITERKSLELQLSFMAFHDSLTKLPNRRLFIDRLNQALLEHKRSGLNLAVLYMDLDKFKLINDSLGHDIGDELLVAFAGRVGVTLRDMDTLARFGGDEFVILLPNLQSAEDAIFIAERIIASLQQPWKLSSRSLNTTSSIGISLFPQHGHTTTELIKQADLALYQAKDNGRNTYALASDITEQVVQQVSYL